MHQLIAAARCPFPRLVALGLVLMALRVPMLAAQQPFVGPPLEGPIVAATPAEADRIVLYDLAGETRRELTFGPGEHYVWDFSPDGCRLLFTVGEPGGLAHLYSAALDGSDVRPLVHYSDLPHGTWGAWEPDWSPDGERIAFTMIREAARLDAAAPRAEGDFYEYRIAWVPAEGGRPAFYSVSGDEHAPQWAPDGSWLAYLAYDERVPGADPSSTAVPTSQPAPGQSLTAPPLVREADLWMVRADGEEKFRLTFFDTGSVGLPRWSPDGNLIGFVYAPVGNNDTFWMIASRPGAIPTQLSYQWALILDQTWFPDSSAILGAARDFQGVAENRLWRVPLVGIADADAAPVVRDPALAYHDFPRFSPDGRWLALRSAYALALLDTSTGDWSLLDEQNLGNTPPVWSPAGFRGEPTCG